ncbi:MAG: NeuD/PglB/VioB family sugar acetyltransferase [Anaerolineales bacterium]
MIKSEILVPLLNANEPEARLVGIHIKDGQAVEKGTRLFTIETTKATSDIESPESGFIRILAAEGATLSVGDKIAVIAEIVDEPLNLQIDGKPKFTPVGTKSPAGMMSPSEALRITKPARQLAESLGVDLATLPTGHLVTEEEIRRAADPLQKMDVKLPSSKKPYLLIYGAGGHAKSLMEIVLQNKIYTIAGIVDDDQQLTGKQILGIQVLGTRMMLSSLMEQGVKFAANGVGGILDINVRVKVFGWLESAGFSFPALIHTRSTVEPSAKMGDGVQVFANAYVGAEAILESRCMVNTNAVVSHDCVIGMYTHIAPGALLAGHVHVGARSLVGMGVTTAIGVRIGDGVRIGNGAIILADVPDKTIVQAGRFWTGKTSIL